MICLLMVGIWWFFEEQIFVDGLSLVLLYYFKNIVRYEF